MALVPYSGAPDVLQGSSAPDDYQHEQASPDAFGAGVGQGLEKLGTGAEQLGAGIQQVHQFWGQIQTDDVLNGAMSSANSQLEKFKSLRGSDALDAQADINKTIDDSAAAARAQLKTPTQQLQFDQSYRAFRERYIAGQISTHANQQAYEYSQGVNAAKADTGQSIIAASPNDPEAFDAGRDQLIQARVQAVHLRYGETADPAIIQQAHDQAISDARQTQIQSLAQRGDPMGAMALADSSKDELGANYSPLVASLRPAAVRAAAPILADQYLRGSGIAQTPSGPVPIPQAPTNQLIKSVIFGQESGDKDNAATSVDNAHGPAQIMPGTFAQYAKPGESIDNPSDNRAVGGRIIDDLSQRFGNDPARVAVAYFSGPGNVAPAGSPTPWLHDAVDGNGKSVSSYVSDVSAKLSKSNMLVDKAATLAKIDNDYHDNPLLASAIKSHVTEQFAIANMAEQSQVLAQQDAQNKASDEYVRGAMTPGTNPQSLIAQLRDDPRLTATSREHIYNFISGMGKKEDPNASAFGSGFTQTFMSVNAPAGDPRRINDASDLLPQLGNGQLTFSGYEHLKKAIDDRNDPGGEGTSSLHNSMMNTAKQVITPKEFMGTGGNGLPDGVQAGKMASFQSAYFSAYRDGIAKGYTPQEMLTPDGKHTLYPLMDAFKPSIGEAVNGAVKAPAFSMDFSKFDLANPEQRDMARKTLVDTYNKSSKTGADWDRAMGMLNQLAKPKVPIQ